MTDLMELTEAYLEYLMIPKRYWDVEADKLSEHTGKGKSPKMMVTQYIDRIDHMMSKGIGLYLWGDNGVGKTSAAVLIAKAAAEHKYSVMFIEAASYIDAVFSQEPFGFDHEITIQERALAVDLLVIDDLGKQVIDQRRNIPRILDRLVRHRSARRLVSIITSNVPVGELTDVIQLSTRETLTEAVIPVKVINENMRKAALQANMKELFPCK